jgi:hypothetical protein
MSEPSRWDTSEGRGRRRRPRRDGQHLLNRSGALARRVGRPGGDGGRVVGGDGGGTVWSSGGFA